MKCNSRSCFMRFRQVSTARSPENPASLAYVAGFSMTRSGWSGDRAQRQNKVCPAGRPFVASSIACIAIGSVRGTVVYPSLTLRCQSQAEGQFGKCSSICCCARSAMFSRFAFACFAVSEKRAARDRSWRKYREHKGFQRRSDASAGYYRLASGSSIEK